MRKNSKKNPKLILEFFDFMEKYFFQVKYEKKIQRNSSYFFENKIIFILKYLGTKNCHFRWLHIFKVIGKSIADHDRDCRSWDFQNMIVSDRRSQFGKMIVSDRRSQKKVSSLTLPHYILKCFMPTLKKQIVWNMLEHKNYIFLKSQEIDDWAHASLPF